MHWLDSLARGGGPPLEGCDRHARVRPGLHAVGQAQVRLSLHPSTSRLAAAAQGAGGRPDDRLSRSAPLAFPLYVRRQGSARRRARRPCNDPILAIAPSATWPPKTWPAERFAETAVELLGPSGPLAGGRALLTGGPGDGRFCEPVRSAPAPSQVIDLVGLDPLTTYACFKRITAVHRQRLGSDASGGRLGGADAAASSGPPTTGGIALGARERPSSEVQETLATTDRRSRSADIE